MINVRPAGQRAIKYKSARGENGIGFGGGGLAGDICDEIVAVVLSSHVHGFESNSARNSLLVRS